MTETDHTKLQRLVGQLYATVGELEEMFPGRHFTPDGHLVGSLGECLVADAYDLHLQKASNRGHDALTRDGREVEIKATQANTVAFRSEPHYVIVVKLISDGTFQEIYNGPGRPVWDQFRNKQRPKNGQFQISLARLGELNRSVAPENRVPRVSQR